MAAAGIIAFKIFARPLAPAYPLDAKVTYSFTVRNLSARPLERTELRVRAPLEKTAFQLCTDLSSSHAFESQIDHVGNRLLVFSFGNLPPHATKIILIKADMRFSAKSNAATGGDPSVFLTAGRYIESDHPEIQRLATRLGARNLLGTVKNIHAWISANIIAEEYSRRMRGAAHTLAHRKGDCSGFATLFAALCRAAGIPARVLEGFRVGSNGVLTAANFHDWAEFYMDRRWHSVDPFEKNFTADAQTYVATRIFAETPGQGPMACHCFETTEKDLWVKMNR